MQDGRTEMQQSLASSATGSIDINRNGHLRQFNIEKPPLGIERIGSMSNYRLPINGNLVDRGQEPPGHFEAS